jgi:hypothetical protein
VNEMGAPLTVEQMILNHNIGVNISDAATFKGHQVTEFSMVGHKHSADDINSGTLAQARLPKASLTAQGIVQLSSNLSSDDEGTAATSKAVNALNLAIGGKANTSHKHDPADINGGTFANQLKAKSEAALGMGIIRNIFVSDQPPSSSVGADGDVYFQYE